ncbi:MAG: hypothetical protein ACR2FY_23790 [Pirellulaceae bacterium]
MNNISHHDWGVWVTPGDTLYIATSRGVPIASLVHRGKRPKEVARTADLLAASKELLTTVKTFKSVCQERISILAEEREEVVRLGVEPDDIDDQLGHWQALLRLCKQGIARAEGKMSR